MDRTFLAEQRQAIRSAWSTAMDCHPARFDVDELTIVDRPDPPPLPYVVMLVSFGIGVVESVDPSYGGFAEELTVRRPRSAMGPSFLGLLAAETQQCGQSVTATPTAVLWALSEPPATRELSDGLELWPVDQAWMAAEQASDRFENGVGEAGIAGLAERNRFGFALVDRAGEPVAVGGVFDTLGLLEIGVDIVPARQREGLAALVVTAAVRAILDDGEPPFYACEATNIRSQRAALACGFIPVASDAFVS